jgi:hypothetical protein
VLIAGVHEARVSEWIRQHVLLAGGHEHWTWDEVELAAQAKVTPRSLTCLCQIDSPAGMTAACLARLRMGHLRYGACGFAPGVPYLESAAARWESYRVDHNTEHLADIENLAALEWIVPSHPTPFWRTLLAYEVYDVGDYCELYLEGGNRAWLVRIVEACREEWRRPRFSDATFHPKDCGGHWSLRNA